MHHLYHILVSRFPAFGRRTFPPRLQNGASKSDGSENQRNEVVDALEAYVQEDNLCPTPDNIFLFHGNSMDDTLHESISMETGVRFDEFDLFYTYLTMQEEFAELIARKAKKGSVFMVYGLEKILPQFDGLRLLTKRPLQDILALYRKV